MYIMVKTYQNLELFRTDLDLVLSIFESRKNNQADINLFSGGLHSRSTPQRMDQCRKADQRGLRKSSSLTNGMSPGRNKTALREYAKEGPRSFLLPPFLSMRPSWATSLMRSV
jgi:hypothetical protein